MSKCNILIFIFINITLFLQAQNFDTQEKQLAKDDPAITSVFYSLKKQYIPLAIKALRSKHVKIQGAAIFMLGKLQHKQSFSHLVKLASQSPKWEIRCASLVALANFKYKTLWTIIGKGLNDPSERVRYTAIRQLGKLKQEKSYKLLHQFLKRKNENINTIIAAYHSLGLIAKRESLNIIFEGLKSDKARIRGACSLALTDMAPYYMPYLLRVLENKNVETAIRYYICLSIGRKKEKLAIKSLYKIVEDPEEKIKLKTIALALLADLDPNKSSPLFFQFVKSSHIPLQRMAILCLGKLRKKKAFPIFKEFLSHKNTRVKEAALWAMTRLDRNVMKPYLLKVLQDKNAPHLCEVIRIVGTIQLIEAIPYLLKLEKTKVRNFACWALESILPRVSPVSPEYFTIHEIIQRNKKTLKKQKK